MAVPVDDEAEYMLEDADISSSSSFSPWGLLSFLLSSFPSMVVMVTGEEDDVVVTATAIAAIAVFVGPGASDGVFVLHQS